MTFIHHLIAQFQSTSYVEWLAFFFALAQVVLAYKNNIYNFYAGIISVCLYVYLFFQAGLFAESMLNVYYLMMSIAGIILWKRQGIEKQITFTSKKDWIVSGSIFIFSWGLLFFALATFTNSNVPFWDSLVSALAWAGTWLLMKRKVSNWVLLNCSNVIAVPLFIYKGLELTALLTVIYFILAILGYFSWRKIAREKV